MPKPATAMAAGAPPGVNAVSGAARASAAPLLSGVDSLKNKTPGKPKGWKKWKRRLSRVFTGSKSKNKTRSKAKGASTSTTTGPSSGDGKEIHGSQEIQPHEVKLSVAKEDAEDEEEGEEGTEESRAISEKASEEVGRHRRDSREWKQERCSVESSYDSEHDGGEHWLDEENDRGEEAYEPEDNREDERVEHHQWEEKSTLSVVEAVDIGVQENEEEEEAEEHDEEEDEEEDEAVLVEEAVDRDIEKYDDERLEQDGDDYMERDEEEEEYAEGDDDRPLGAQERGDYDQVNPTPAVVDEKTGETDIEDDHDDEEEEEVDDDEHDTDVDKQGGEDEGEEEDVYSQAGDADRGPKSCANVAVDLRLELSEELTLQGVDGPSASGTDAEEQEEEETEEEEEEEEEEGDEEGGDDEDSPSFLPLEENQQFDAEDDQDEHVDATIEFPVEDTGLCPIPLDLSPSPTAPHEEMASNTTNQQQHPRGHPNHLKQFIVSIPSEFQILRQVTTWYTSTSNRNIQHKNSTTTIALALASSEWRLLALCLERHDWTLAQLLAEKLQRDHLLFHTTTSATSTDTIGNQSDDVVDVILAQCAA